MYATKKDVSHNTVTLLNLHIIRDVFYYLFILQFRNKMSQRKQRIAAEQKLYNAQHGKIQKPDVYGTRKRLLRLNHQRNDTSDDEEFEALDIPVDSDSVSAADFLIKSNPKSNIPLCYIHQIYSILPNNTIVDRELVIDLRIERLRSSLI